MRIYLIILLAIVLFTIHEAKAEYFYIGAGVGKNATLFSDTGWVDNGELGCAFRVGNRHHLAGNFYGDVGYAHYSQCASGPPFNDDYEDSLDAFYYWVEYRL